MPAVVYPHEEPAPAKAWSGSEHDSCRATLKITLLVGLQLVRQQLYAATILYSQRIEFNP